MTKKCAFDSDSLVDLYHELGAGGYESIHNLVIVGEERHRRSCVPGTDVGQSWKSVKGTGLEKVLKFILSIQLEDLGLELVPLRRVKHLLLIDFGIYGRHHPDVDLAVCPRESDRVIAILSIKASLRERATQTPYWRTKLRNNAGTDHVKVYFVTPNSDDTLRNDKKVPIKQRAILETDVDATYIVNLPGRSIGDYLYEGKESNIRLVDDLANDLYRLSLERR